MISSIFPVCIFLNPATCSPVQMLTRITGFICSLSYEFFIVFFLNNPKRSIFFLLCHQIFPGLPYHFSKSKPGNILGIFFLLFPVYTKSCKTQCGFLQLFMFLYIFQLIQTWQFQRSPQICTYRIYVLEVIKFLSVHSVYVL